MGREKFLLEVMNKFLYLFIELINEEERVI